MNPGEYRFVLTLGISIGFWIGIVLGALLVGWAFAVAEARSLRPRLKPSPPPPRGPLEGGAPPDTRLGVQVRPAPPRPLPERESNPPPTPAPGYSVERYGPVLIHTFWDPPPPGYEAHEIRRPIPS